MPRLRINPYKQGSRSALALATALGGRVLKKDDSKFVPQADDTIINWGDSKMGDLSHCRVLNKGGDVARASNKYEAFLRMRDAGVSVPAFTSDKTSVDWNGPTVVRHKLSGHSGEGIEIRDAGDLPNAPLYVQYVPKKVEYRVHVVGERVVLVQRKARDNRCNTPNWKVRNHDNGFIFVRNDVNPPRGVEEQAVRAVKALGLDFGATDVIWNEKQQRAYVLEVNCAPGLQGTTITDYAEAFRNIINGI